MVYKRIEFDRCDITQESAEALDTISTAMHCIEQNFYNMEFTVQKYENNLLKETYPYKLGNQLLKVIVVDLDNVNDEFYIHLLHPVTQQVFDGICKQSDTLNIEVVTMHVAEENDKEFLSGNVVNTYELGGVNSYYKRLGTLNDVDFYYREL